MDEVFKSAEIRVAAYSDLTAEQGRALYKAYVNRGIALERLKHALVWYADKLNYFGWKAKRKVSSVGTTMPVSAIRRDNGKRARKALRDAEGERARE